jgi:hypothetical protein
LPTNSNPVLKPRLNLMPTSRNYEVTFYKKDFDPHTGKRKDERLGSVVIDDHGVNQEMTIAAKAFRHAQGRCFAADRVVVVRR